MLIQFSDSNGRPVYINPQYVIAVREEKHFGRPGVGSGDEYRDTLVVTTKHEFNVQEPPDAVVREVNRASMEMLRAAGGAEGTGASEAAGMVPPPRDEPA
jgi:hypothetical protein